MTNFEELFGKYNPLDAVPGGADLERKNLYWINLGILREQDRIIKLLEDEIQRLVDMAGNRIHGDTIWRPAGIEVCERTIALIKGENK